MVEGLKTINNLSEQPKVSNFGCIYLFSGGITYLFLSICII